MGIVEGILFGVMGAALAGVYLLIAGLTRAVVGRAKSWLDARIGLWLRVVVLATTGGAAVGALGWAMPLTLTDGAAQLTPVLFKTAQVCGSRVATRRCEMLLEGEGASRAYSQGELATLLPPYRPNAC